MELNTTSSVISKSFPKHQEESMTDKYEADFALYVGIGVGVGVAICAIIVVVLVRHGRFRYLRDRSWSCVSTKKIFIRGFSTVSQRGMIDSTAEFEMINTSASPSVSSDTEKDNRNKNPPRKPGRNKSRSSSFNNKYENVMLDPHAGFVVRKSVSMNSNIPYIDNSLDRPIKEEEEEDDDVFT